MFVKYPCPLQNPLRFPWSQAPPWYWCDLPVFLPCEWNAASMTEMTPHNKISEAMPERSTFLFFHMHFPHFILFLAPVAVPDTRSARRVPIPSSAHVPQQSDADPHRQRRFFMYGLQLLPLHTPRQPSFPPLASSSQYDVLSLSVLLHQIYTMMRFLSIVPPCQIRVNTKNFHAQQKIPLAHYRKGDHDWHCLCC